MTAKPVLLLLAVPLLAATEAMPNQDPPPPTPVVPCTGLLTLDAGPPVTVTHDCENEDQCSAVPEHQSCYYYEVDVPNPNGPGTVTGERCECEFSSFGEDCCDVVVAGNDIIGFGDCGDQDPECQTGSECGLARHKQGGVTTWKPDCD